MASIFWPWSRSVRTCSSRFAGGGCMATSWLSQALQFWQRSRPIGLTWAQLGQLATVGSYRGWSLAQPQPAHAVDGDATIGAGVLHLDETGFPRPKAKLAQRHEGE